MPLLAGKQRVTYLGPMRVRGFPLPAAWGRPKGGMPDSSRPLRSSAIKREINYSRPIKN